VARVAAILKNSGAQELVTDVDVRLIAEYGYQLSAAIRWPSAAEDAYVHRPSSASLVYTPETLWWTERIGE
jgi:hypothetical protein